MQFLAKLLNTPAQNEYTIKNSFEKVNKIELIKLLELFELVELFDQVYQYFSLDVISLFNSIHLIKTIHIAIDSLYKDTMNDKQLIKITLKKVYLCIFMIFLMSSNFCLFLGNLIMTKLEKEILKTKIKSEKLEYYIQCKGDMLLLAKEVVINYELDKFNSFHNILKFTMVRFKENNAHFLGKTIDMCEEFVIRLITIINDF